MLVLKPEDARIKNAITLLHLLLREKNISRVEISRITGLTKTTVSSIIKDFLILGIIEESHPESTGNVGKSPTPLHIRKESVYTIGVHLGRERIRTALLDAQMNVITKKKGRIFKNHNTSSILHMLFASINSVIKEAKRNNMEVGAIGVGIPGPLDAKTGVVRHPPKFKGWKDVPLKKILQDKYHLPTWIENDANVGALAEKWHGGGKQLKNFMYILANEGIGAGIIINDELYQGAYDYVGELGHSLLYEKGKLRYLEDVAGADLLMKQAKRKGINVNNMIEMAMLLKSDRGKEKVEPIIQESAKWIGIALINAVHVMGPQTVFVGGKMSVLKETLLKPIREIFSQYLFGDQKVEVMLSKIPDDAVTIGAAIYATTKCLEKRSIEYIRERKR